jgi:hypothetical protein
MRAASKAFLNALAKAHQSPRAPKLGTPGARKPVLFSAREALKRSLQQLAEPPLRDHIERPKPVGQCRYRFALPLELCPSTNMTRHGQAWKLAKMKKQCLGLMQAQLRPRPTSALTGRPQVLCIRFSSVEPDAYADWAKIPVDCLKKLGVIAEDNPRAINLSQYWEPAPPKSGFCIVEVWTGRAA